MRVILAPGCDRAWRESLSPWQESQLAALYRQGRGLPDRTNHGSDARWRQSGVKTRSSNGIWHRTRRRDGHERVVISPTDYGFVKLFIRRMNPAHTLDGDTGEMIESPGDVWTVIERWWVSETATANYPPPHGRRL